MKAAIPAFPYDGGGAGVSRENCREQGRAPKPAFVRSEKASQKLHLNRDRAEE